MDTRQTTALGVWMLNIQEEGSWGGKKQQHLNTHFISEEANTQKQSQWAVACCLPSSYRSTAAGQRCAEQIPSQALRFHSCLWRPVALSCFVCLQTQWYLFFFCFSTHGESIVGFLISQLLSLNCLYLMLLLVLLVWHWRVVNESNKETNQDLGCQATCHHRHLLAFNREIRGGKNPLDCRTTRCFGLIPVDLRRLWTRLRVIKESRSLEIDSKRAHISLPVVDSLFRGRHKKY